MRKRAQRGSTIIEVMVAAAVLLVAIIGFVAVMNSAASATAIGHRRTVGAHIRQSVVDRMLVTPRDRLRTITANTWIVDACWDLESREVGRNAARATGFTCPDGTVYRTWFQIVPVVVAPATSADESRTWNVLTYAERVEPGCTPDTRFSSVACLGTDLFLTD